LRGQKSPAFEDADPSLGIPGLAGTRRAMVKNDAKKVHFLIMDGQDPARLLYVYGKFRFR
jgi:hypothetical protein